MLCAAGWATSSTGASSAARTPCIQITDAGLAYLKRVDTETALGGGEQQELRTLASKQEASVRESPVGVPTMDLIDELASKQEASVRESPVGVPTMDLIEELTSKQEASVRERLRELLLDMDPFAFEHLVKRLLEKMDYQKVEVTTRSGDGGVDVIADIEVGITSVREVVQAKRHKQAVQRKDLDALRGSLYRFDAVRGTIITTSRFSKGTEEAASARGAHPITLIDGDTLVDLLIKHGIGVKKLRSLEVLEIVTDPFSHLEEDA